jgi:putative tryptophan/tyrosine transport system substrate-binding protein
MRRREFIAGLGGAAVAWPLATRAQQPTMPVIGLLGDDSPEATTGRVQVFRQGLGETGYVEGRNVAIEYRWAYGELDRVPELAADLIRRRVAVLAVTFGSLSTVLIAKALTTTIPIVFNSGTDPVRLGLVASLNMPGGNLTGVTWLSNELESKRLGLLNSLIKAKVIAALLNPDNVQAEFQARDLKEAAHSIGIDLHIAYARSESELDQAFASFAREGAGGLLVGTDARFSTWRDRLLGLAARNAIPAIYYYREWATAGGLMSYGSSIIDAIRLTGVYAGRILKGEKPAEMPVMQPTKFELVINRSTAKALGLEIPPQMLALADEVIE